MILPIVAYGDPILNTKAKPITPDYPDLKALIANMYETMYNANGVGLAAPQIGQSIRLFVVDAEQYDEENTPAPKKSSSTPKYSNAAVNPGPSMRAA